MNSQQTEEQDRLHRQRCAEWFAQMYGNELNAIFGNHQHGEAHEDREDADD